MKNNSNYDSKPFNRPLKGGDTNGPSENTHEPVQAKFLEVEVNGNFEKAFKIFRSIVQKERILSLYKEKGSFEKPSDKKRRKRNEMKRKLMELEMKDENPNNFRKKRYEEEEQF